MKKRILIVLAIMVLLSLTVLAACQNCEHEYVGNWDDNKHWQECKLCHNDKKDEEPHNLTWVSTDETNHWQVCECGYISTVTAAHADNNADGKCDTCGRDLHEHSYAWESDAAEHWQVCACGDATTHEAHVDVKNNETQAEGADGKCDACARENYAVTFNMKNHGDAVAAQIIYKGGKATAPETPADDDAWSFGGWYKESACENVFDFETEVINEATVIYAKWTEDTTEGASKAHAYVLTLGEENLTEAKLNEAVYYKYVAQTEGRYTISLYGFSSLNGTFTTNLTGDTVYGKDCDLDEITVDIDANHTLYILYTYLGETVEDITVSPLVTEVTDEPLPEGLFPSGEYSNGTYTLELVRETKEITFQDTKYIAKYIGGKYNRLSFIQDFSALGLGKQTIALSPNNDGTYNLTIDNGSPSVLNYVVPQEPVALSEIVGYYESTSNAAITELYIYAGVSETATSVRVLQNGYYNLFTNAEYNTEKNQLIFNYSNVITLNLDENNSVVSIKLNGITYERKSALGAVPPESLPINAEDFSDVEYNGATHVIRTQYGSQYFGATGYNGITVMNYEEDTGVYTIAVSVDNGFENYKLTISQDRKTIEFYNEEGEKIDTLVKFEWIYHDLNAVAATLAIEANDFQKNLYLLQAKQSAWYKFAASQGAIVYSNLNPYDYTNLDDSRVADADIAMYIAEGSLVAVYMQTPANATVTVAIAEAPLGTEQSKPVVITGSSATVDVVSTQTYYFTYTAPAAGSYLVKVTDDWGGTMLMYSVNGTNYGYDDNSLSWIGGLSFSNPYASVTVTGDNLVLDIRVSCQEIWDNVTVAVSEDYSADATMLTLTGEDANDSLTVTATAATGANYGIASTKGQAIVVTGNAAFSIILQGGTVLESEDVDGVHTVTIPNSDGTAVYFKLQAETQQTLTLTQTFAKGSEGYPVEVALTDGVGTIEVPVDMEAPVSSIYFTVAPGTYSLSTSDLSMEWFYANLYKNGVQITNGQVIVVEERDVLSCIHSDEQAVSVTIKQVTYIFSEEQAGTYKGTATVWEAPVDVTITFDRVGLGTIIVEGLGTFDISIKEENGVYSFWYNDGTYFVTLTFVNGNIVLDDNTIDDEDQSYYFDEPCTLEKQAAKIEGTYVGYIGNDNDGANAKLEIDGANVVYYRDMGEGELVEMMSQTFTVEGNTYKFVDMWGVYTIVISADGNSVEFSDGDIGWSGTLTKQA